MARYRAGRTRQLASTVTAVTCSATLLLTAVAAAAVVPPNGNPVQLAGPIALNDCVVPDNGAPELRGLTVTPTSVDLGAGPVTIRVQVDAVDAGGPGPASGIATMYVLVAPDTGGFEEQLYPSLGVDGRWAATMTIYPGQRSGQWSVHEISMTDRAGLIGFLADDQLDGRVGGANGFTVQGPVDRAPPRLTSFSLKRTSVTVRGRSTRVGVRAVATDDLVVRSVTAYAQNARTHRTVQAELDRTGTGSWSGGLPVRAWNDNGRWTLGATVRDGAGHQHKYGVGPRFTNPSPGLAGVAFTVRGGGTDHQGPQLLSVQVRPTLVDVRSADRVLTVLVHLRDLQSGFARGEARIRATHQAAPLTLVSGTSHDGIFPARALLTRCHTPAGTYRVEIKRKDRAGNRQGTEIDDPIRVLAEDHQAPEFIRATQLRTTEPLSFTWTEDVAGITTATAPLVLARPPQDGSSEPVPGTWACVAANTGPVDCVAGPVRTAVFTPETSLTANIAYLMDFNPAHVLSVSDLAGNPAYGYWFSPL